MESLFFRYASNNYMQIIKGNGEKVRFHPEKIAETLKRIGAQPDLITHVVQKVKSQVKEDMTTKEVYSIVRTELHKENRCIAHRYNLRRGLLRLGPAGFKFEKYVAAILEAYQYKTEIPDKEISGLCVKHEIDVVAKQEGKIVMIEAKFRNRFEDTVTLKDAMATWARYLDLVDGAKAGKCEHFNEVWVVTNGRFSDRAMQYGVCKGMHMVGWSNTNESLARMVDHAALYPITVLDKLRQWEMEKLASKNYMLCSQIAESKPNFISAKTGIPVDRMKSIIDTCKEIVQG